MEDSRVNDKIKMQEIMTEINNLKNLTNELANNTRGESLENYITTLSRNITLFNNKTESIYNNVFKSND